MLRWQPPPLNGQNGEITGYKIRYRKGSRRSEAAETTGGTQLNKLIDGNKLGLSCVRIKPYLLDYLSLYCTVFSFLTPFTAVSQTFPHVLQVNVTVMHLLGQYINRWSEYTHCVLTLSYLKLHPQH